MLCVGADLSTKSQIDKLYSLFKAQVVSRQVFILGLRNIVGAEKLINAAVCLDKSKSDNDVAAPTVADVGAPPAAAPGGDGVNGGNGANLSTSPCALKKEECVEQPAKRPRLGDQSEQRASGSDSYVPASAADAADTSDDDFIDNELIELRDLLMDMVRVDASSGSVVRMRYGCLPWERQKLLVGKLLQLARLLLEQSETKTWGSYTAYTMLDLAASALKISVVGDP